MKKTIIAILALLPLSLMAQNEEHKDWTFKGVTGLNMSQTSLSNWSAGGENTMAGNVYLNASAALKRGKWSWDNSIVTDFGQTYSRTNKWQTSVDKLNLTTKGGYAIAQHWNISALADFLTQFTPGYENAAAKNNGNKYISNFMAPGYLNMALGADYRPNDNFSVLLSPVTGKLTFVTDKYLSDLGAFGVKPGETLFAQLGASIIANYNKDIINNVNLNTKLTLFSAYTHNFGNVDVLWDVMLSAKINSYLSATLTTNLIYDDDIKSIDSNGNMAGPKVQFREIVGLGLSYNF